MSQVFDDFDSKLQAVNNTDPIRTNNIKRLVNAPKLMNLLVKINQLQNNSLKAEKLKIEFTEHEA